MFIGTFLTVLADSVKGLTIPNVWPGVVMAMHMPEERQDRFTGLILKMEYFYEKKLKQHVHREFYYEDFSSDISTTLQYICEDLNVPFQGVPKSELKVQRKSYDQTALDEFRTFMKQRLSQV